MLQLLGLIALVVVFIFKVFGFLIISAIGLLFTTGGIIPFIFFFAFFGFFEVLKVKNKKRPVSDVKDETERQIIKAARAYKEYNENKGNTDKEEDLFDPDYTEDTDTEEGDK